MKITKEEKQLYKLLDVVNKIFGRTNDRTAIVGNLNKLYFYTLGYCGVFISKDNDETLVDAYDFATHHYELKQLPNKSFVLDALTKIDSDEQKLYYNVIDFVDSRINHKEWIAEMFKDYDHKIAKIAIDSGKWIRDDDISYLKAFAEFEIYNGTDCLVIRSQDDYCDIYLVFTDSVVIPDIEDSTQMKIDAYENNQGIAEKIMDAINTNPPAEEPPEEFEDEEYIEESFEDEDDDPMA